MSVVPPSPPCATTRTSPETPFWRLIFSAAETPVATAAALPKSEWIQLLMAAYSESDQPAEASRLAERIAANAPSDKRAQLNLAATYIQTGQDDKALAVYEQLLLVRRRSNVSQGEVARDLGCTRAWVQMMEAGVNGCEQLVRYWKERVDAAA